MSVPSLPSRHTKTLEGTPSIDLLPFSSLLPPSLPPSSPSLLQLKCRVAIKWIRTAFLDPVDALRVYREVVLLRGLRASRAEGKGVREGCEQHLIGLLNILAPPTSPSAFEELFFVLEYKETNLAHLLHSPQALTPAHVKVFLFQLLQALAALQARHVVHRDIKVR